jgi:hypothetical protein
VNINEKIKEIRVQKKSKIGTEVNNIFCLVTHYFLYVVL